MTTILQSKITYAIVYPMHIKHPSHIRWFRETGTDPLEFLSGRNGKKIRSSINKLDASKITHVLKPLTKDFFTEFTPLYESIVGSKQNSIVHDVQAKTLGKINAEFPYYALSLYEKSQFIGGTIFSLREDRVAYAYRAYLSQWSQATIKAQPALIAEYLVAQFAIKHRLLFVSHGRDRNPYGLNSAIGLATFKLSVGCRPLLTEDCEPHELDPASLKTDTLILLYPETKTPYISKAFLYTSRETEQKHIQVTKYPELLEVETYYRD